MGNECDQCQPNGGCSRQVLGRGIEPRAKLNLSRVNQSPVQKNTKKQRLNHQVNMHTLLTENSPQQALKKKENNSTQDKQKSIQMIQLQNGVIFEGQISQNYRNGSAKYIWPNKTIIEALYHNDIISDKIRIDIPQQLTYSGSINDNAQITGIGNLRLADGSQYDGSWKNGKPHGKGVHRLPDNTVYEGQFHEGIKTGQGKCSLSNGTIYQGSFLNGLFHGEGSIRYVNGKTYTGQWQLGMIHGHGTLVYDDGKKYVGDFKKGLRNGYGTFYFGDGRYWQGQWVNNYQNGRGKYYNKQKIQQGYWKDGHKIQSSQKLFIQSKSRKENVNPGKSNELIRIEEQY